ncbi:radical SAM protein [Candidatus Pelagibacter sp.]|nr:radical SAM protein [Candidatus Pelagibacter sp.]
MDTKNSLGTAKIHQTSIDESIDQLTLEKKLLDEIQNILITDDFYEKKFFDYLKENKKLIFSINKHEELYCSKISDVNHLFKYLCFRYKFRESGKRKIVFDLPMYLLIEPVSTCNLRCPFCFQTDKSFTRKPYMGLMKFELFKKILDEADENKVGAITFASRGEPTLHKQLGEMLEYASNKRNIFEIKLNSNATFLREELIHKILRSRLTQIVISADHYEKTNYERLRLGANYEQILKNVDNLYKIREKDYPQSNLEIRISGVDADRNIDRKAFKNFWIKRSDHVSIGLPMERWNTYKNKIHDDITDPCEKLWDRMYIWFDGKVNPCDADYKSNLSFGDVSKDSLKNVWKSDKIKILREKHLNKERLKFNPCDRCGVTFE